MKNLKEFEKKAMSNDKLKAVKGGKDCMMREDPFMTYRQTSTDYPYPFEKPLGPVYPWNLYK